MPLEEIKLCPVCRNMASHFSGYANSGWCRTCGIGIQNKIAIDVSHSTLRGWCVTFSLTDRDSTRYVYCEGRTHADKLADACRADAKFFAETYSFAERV